MRIFNEKHKAMFKRLFMRSVVLLLLTISGFAFMEVLIDYAQNFDLDIQTQFPEIMIIVRAVTILTWTEMCLLWIRMAVQPDIDVQKAAREAETNPMASAMVFGVHQVTWLVRIILFLQLCEFTK